MYVCARVCASQQSAVYHTALQYAQRESYTMGDDLGDAWEEEGIGFDDEETSAAAAGRVEYPPSVKNAAQLRMALG